MNDALLAEPAADVGSAGVPAEVVAVSDNFVNLMRTFGRARARMMQAAAHDVEWSAHVLLKCLSNEGPMRASAISDYLQSDPSTVSRQVAALVKDGLLERRADPADGRASLLVLTPKADAVLADHERIRLDFFAGMLGDWSEADLRTFAAMLDRFTTDYEHANHDWLTGRIASRAVPAGGTN
jgi:DNA-binding MarR family transcriptional regulator